MAEYNLFDHQRDLLRKMVGAFKAGCGPDFISVSNSMFTGIAIIAKNGRREQIECDPNDLAALGREGLIELTTYSSGAITHRAVRAVENNFSVSENPSPASPSIGSLTQNIYGHAIQNAVGNSANQMQSSDVNILAALKATGVAQPERNEIENLMDEWATQTGGTATINGNVTAGYDTGGVANIIFGGSAQCTISGSVYVGGSSTAAIGQGNFQQSNGSVTIGGALKIWNSTGSGATLSGGTLTVGSLNTSGVPSDFTWTAGTLQLTAQPLNFTSGSDVDASLGSSLTLGSGQTLIVDNWEWLYGEGAYISQNTGSSNTCQGLYIGPTAGSGSVADYFQDGGSLTSNGTPEYVGYAFSGGPGGIGYFYQYGGTNNTPELDVGYSNTGVIGEYDLYNGATLTVSGNEYLGVYSQGTFNQNGGTHAIGSNLYIGGNTTGAVGDFNLDGGYLDVSNVNVGGSAGQGAFTLSNGTATIFVNLNVASTAGSYLYQSGGSLSASGTSNNGLIEQTGGTSYLGILSGTGSTTIGGGSSTATMTVASLNQSSVTINAMGTLKVTGGSDNTVNTLTINGGQLDLTNTHLFIDYGGGPDPVSTIRAYLISGFAGGAWNGPGIDSSIAALPANSHYGIGYADGADGVVAGLSSGQIEIKYTLLGDADLDGSVTGSDFTILVGNLGKSAAAWDKGDFDYDGAVTGSDFTALASNLGKSASGASVEIPASDYAAIDAFAAANGLMADVPEPSTLGVLGLAAAGVLARRRRSA